MDEKLKRIMGRINVSDDYLEEFKNAKVISNKVDDLNNTVDVVIQNDDDISSAFYDELTSKFSSFFDASVSLKILNETRTSTHFKEHFDNVLNTGKSVIPMIELINSKTSFNGNDLSIKAVNEVEKYGIIDSLDLLNEIVSNYGTNFTYTIDLDDELREEINTNIETESNEISSRPYEKVEVKQQSSGMFPRRRKKNADERTIFGNLIPKEDEVWKISSLHSEKDNIVIEGKIFGTEEFTPASKAFKILTLKITDGTDSILAKTFIRDDDEYNTVVKKTKPGTYVKLKGSTKIDQYSNDELVLNVYDIYESDHKKENRKDETVTKRVELHAHTMMSGMDGITKLDLGKHTSELVERTIKMGYRGVAITDHSGCQAFPISFAIINSHNKDVKKKINSKKEELEAKKAEATDQNLISVIDEDLENINEELKHPKLFKGLYGTELTLVDDIVDIVIRPTKDDLLSTTYVVFDTETTGFNAGGGDQMIEIGAVKLKDGEIIDRFDELINPHRHIPDNITKLTGISDDMVEDKDDEETVTKKFLEWTGDLPLVAHNAKFDISFLGMAMKKYDLGELKNTVIDTLELSRTLDQGEARHSLSAITKRYKVPFDEEEQDEASEEVADGLAIDNDEVEVQEANTDPNKGKKHHRADYDAEATAKVYHKMMQKLSNQNLKKISDVDKLIALV